MYHLGGEKGLKLFLGYCENHGGFQANQGAINFQTEISNPKFENRTKTNNCSRFLWQIFNHFTTLREIIFSQIPTDIELILFRISEPRWFQICAQIFHIFLGSKTTALQRGLKTVKKGWSGHTLKGCSLWSEKDVKSLSADSESAKFKYSKNINSIFLAQPKKSSFFPL